MSTTSIVNSKNLSNKKIVTEFFEQQAIDLLKNLRFDVGKICHHKLKYMLRLERLVSEGYCQLDTEQNQILREELITKAILRIREI